jgi:DNA-binding transcriptional regulator YdaS (Cro superfamily)
MKTEEAIQLAGSRSMLARILGLTPAAITQWGDNVPMLRVYQLRDLRPEWFAKQQKITAAA